MLPTLQYRRIATVDEAVALAKEEGHRFLAGGIELLPLLKEGLQDAETLLDLAPLKASLGQVEVTREGGRVGALASLQEVARHPAIKSHYRALAQACRLTASLQIRQQGTLAGNLLQINRCEYFRNNYGCYLQGGDTCLASQGDDRHHALWTEGTCHSVYPSDPATALVALGAKVRWRDAEGEKEAPLEELFGRPVPEDPRHLKLPQGALMTGIHLPPAPTWSVFLKVMERGTWTFSAVSLAASARLEGDLLRDVRIVLGGVAARPWRAEGAEALLEGAEVEVLEGVGEIFPEMSRSLLEGLRPGRENGYKLALLQGLFAKALADLRGALGR
ncbi:MAG: FAD binding domain-containing protein [Clostridiales bacterium]|nr:FAD binding domain-containing protein [Clostridiales bacterium]